MAARITAARSTGRGARPTLVGAVSALAAVLIVVGCAGPPRTTGSGVETVQIVSHPMSEGETIESVADDFYGDRAAAGYLADVNGVSVGTALEPGAVVNVPVGSADIERYQRRTEAKILYNGGTILAGRGALERAEEEFRAALTADPEFFDAGYNLGVVLLEQGRPSAAAAAFEKMSQRHPSDPSVLYGLAKSYFDLGRNEEALAGFERVLSIDPSNEDAHYSRAVTLLALARRDEAIVSFDGHLRRFPEGVWAARVREKLEQLARETAEEEWRNRSQ